MPESELKEGGQIGALPGFGGGSSKNGAGGTVQKWNTKGRGRRDEEDPEVEQEVQSYIDSRH